MASMDGPTPSAPAPPTMIPSQVSLSRQSSNVSGEQQRGQRRRGGGKNKKKGSEEAEEKHQSDGNAQAARSKPKRNRNRKKKGNAGQKQESSSKTDDAVSTDQKPADTKPRAKRRPRARGKKYPWRRHIPPGTMDPITLDPLVSLPYPPFALVATEPYIPVPAWPVPEESTDAPQPVLDKEDEHRKRLEEQWGKDRLTCDSSQDQELVLESSDKKNNIHHHLYDGRALAYYLVSQLQFIDPLNRRDLTREELLNLDAYLSRHGFHDLRVVEAYDAKGITMSSAGRAGQTAAGRAQIMQQEAQTLLNALFGNGPPPAAARVDTSRQEGLREQYAAHQREAGRAGSNRWQELETEDVGIYAAQDDDGGMIIIDDDANPGLRGAGFRSAQADSALDVDAPSFRPNTLWSASHITNQYSHEALVRRENFPSLPSTGNTTASVDSLSSSTRSAEKPPSLSLKKITKVVKKTDPAELQRQREAREAALQRQWMIANMSQASPGSTGYSPATMITPGSLHPGQGAVQPPVGPTEGQLERNRALANALGVAPATARQNYNSGWARPTTVNVELDQFGNELNAAQYPDSLVLAARERMTELLKLEKRWKTFLADDTSASLPLKPMDRPLRTFVHEYSDFWRLHTESFDPEPKRYIHCVKLGDTSIPHPLLSEAARKWRGPGQLPPQPQQPRPINEAEHASQQTAGQSTVSREFPPAPPREPLKLLPRSADRADSSVRAETQTDAQLNSRFEALSAGRERKKLELTPRTKPAELPPFQPNKGGVATAADERLREKERERARKEHEEAERKMLLLEGAFASSDEESSLSSGWEEEEQLYSGSESEAE